MSLLDHADVQLDASQTRPVKVHGSFPLASGGGLSEDVKEFLVKNADELVVPFGAAGLELVKDVRVADHNVLRYNHTVDGMRVFGAQMIVMVDDTKRIRSLDLFTGSILMRPPSADVSLLSAREAHDSMAVAIGPVTMRSEPNPPEPIWFPTDNGFVRAFEMIVPTAAPLHDWQIVVDAQNGHILLKRDLIKEMPNGVGLVFDPNPVVTANNNGLRDPTATAASCGFTGTPVVILDAQRVSRTLLDLKVSNGNYVLDGPWCKIHDFATPPGPNPSEPSGNFSYSSNDVRFGAVMVYYHVDTFQRYLQSIGITNAHASAIQCDPLDNSIISAWFSPVDGGLHFSNSGTCKPDRASDADCMIHEYQHAIQNDLVPGWGGPNPITGRDEAGAMGEGAGDFVACVYFSDRAGGFQREVFEDWVFGPAGLRRVDGAKIYPTNWSNEVHADGEIWSSALWNIYRAIGGDVIGANAIAAHETARQSMLISLFNSYPLLATNATMPEGAEALMRTNALLNVYRGQHLCAMLQSFHDRGILGVSAGSEVFIRDDLLDPGTSNYRSQMFWDSPDVWIRNTDDGGITHQQPIAGQDNWFYARVTNKGSAPGRACVVTFNVKARLGTEFIYPDDFTPYISAVPAFNIAAGDQVIVRAKWPSESVPAELSNDCILVSIFLPEALILPGAHVWESPNLAQKNVIIPQ